MGISFRHSAGFGKRMEYTLCEMTTYILVTQPVYADIHPGLVTIPLDMEQEFTVPYGLMIANDPSPAVKRFISAVEWIRDSLTKEILNHPIEVCVINSFKPPAVRTVETGRSVSLSVPHEPFAVPASGTDRALRRTSA